MRSGAIALTRTPELPRSTARLRVNPVTAALYALYTGRLGMARNAFDRRDVHDAPLPPLDHAVDEGPGAEQHVTQVGRVERVPCVGPVVEEVVARPRGSGRRCSRAMSTAPAAAARLGDERRVGDVADQHGTRHPRWRRSRRPSRPRARRRSPRRRPARPRPRTVPRSPRPIPPPPPVTTATRPSRRAHGPGIDTRPVSAPRLPPPRAAARRSRGRRPRSSDRRGRSRRSGPAPRATSTHPRRAARGTRARSRRRPPRSGGRPTMRAADRTRTRTRTRACR